MSRKAFNYTLDIDVVSRLSRYSEKTMIPKSQIVTKAIEQYLDEQKFEVDEEK